MPLDEMIGSDRVHHILGSPLGHVTARAVRRGCMLPGCDRPRELGPMALSAGDFILLRRFLSPGNVVDVVTAPALQPTLALEEAPGLPKPVDGVHEFEFLFFARSRGVVKEQPVVAQRLAWPVIERSPVIAPECIRERKTGRLQMALHADFFPTLTAQGCRIYYCLSNLLPRRLAGTCQLHMPLSRPVAPLAVDSLGKRIQIYRFCEGLAVALRNLRIPVVAIHAVVGDFPPKALVVRSVVARIHGPLPALVRVPPQREFQEGIAGGPRKEGAGMISRPDDEVDTLLHHIYLATLGAGLVSPLHKPISLPNYPKCTFGRLVVVLRTSRPHRHVARIRSGKRPSHAG